LQTLEAYLSDGIYRDREDITAVDIVLRDTGETIDQTFDEERSDWPYERGHEPDRTITSYSQSTAAMMTHAIDLLLGIAQHGKRKAPYPFDLGKDAAALKEKRGRAVVKLVHEIRATRDNRAKEPTRVHGKAVVTYSGTYGLNDPLTLSFLAEVFSVSKDKCPAWLLDHCKQTAEALLELDPAKQSESFFCFEKKEAGGTSKTLSNAFVPLRIVRACEKLSVQDLRKSRYLSYFQSTLHQQLSYSSIPDSRFDPAELIFCLEGVLHLSEQSIDTPMFERVLDVLEAAQQTSAHWRPNKPFLRNERGLVLFPVSVEAANSLLWSCTALEKYERFHRYSERYIALFRRFWGWLAARRVTLGPKLSGWHSDHIADPDSIQLWDTAQVVGFLLGYRRSLHNHIARTTLRLARFDIRQPTSPNVPWSQETLELEARFRKPEANLLSVSESNAALEVPATAQSASDKPSQPPSQSTVETNFEPATSLGPYFKTYEKIKQAFLLDWLKGEPTNFSMLLYGPPGTGKTTVAENLADALGFTMVTITVSDFLAEGGGGIEARAKMMFEVLCAQTNCVILFDEIDELVLDRSSERHKEQETLFKFMTPGMLTKLNNLRRAKRSIFIMATNYAYRIDPAIRRTGRIDENYLLLPPDSAARRRMINLFLKEAAKINKLAATDSLHPSQLDDAAWNRLAEASLFLGYKDIDTAVSRVLRNAPDEKTVAALERELLTWGRTTTLGAYKKAFAEGDREAVEHEFLPLVYMAAQEGDVAAKGNSSLNIESVAKEIKVAGRLAYPSSSDLKANATKFVNKRNGSGSAAQ
jgi:hypothetical protein